MKFKRPVLLFLVCAAGLYAQESGFGERVLFGDAAMAERYVIWAEREFAGGRTAQALAGLERGADYGAVSADLLYLLARARKTAGEPAGRVLDACAAALENGGWMRYDAAQCRLLEAETLVRIRRYNRALELLEAGAEIRVPAPGSSEPEGGRGLREDVLRQDGEDALVLRLRCRMYLGHDREFILLLKEALDRYPRDTRFLRILFAFCGRNRPSALLTELTALALKRLPLVLEDDPGLAYIASPFMRDREEAIRYVGAYRAAGNPSSASLPQALYWGLIEDTQAAAELFAFRTGDVPQERVLDRELVLDVWRNLRSEEGRAALRRNLLGYTGVIQEDEDRDGVFEVTVSYRDGLIHSYSYDADQDGLPEWKIYFSGGVPSEAETALNVLGGSEGRALVRWERYPAVQYADLDRTRYLFRPADFFFTPLRFSALVAGGPDYPLRNELDTMITARSLLSFALMTERENKEFPGSIERTSFIDSVPQSALTYVNGKLAAVTEFRNGRPYVQKLDLDLDGRMETVRYFSGDEYGVIVFSESDWDGDGIYEYAEALQDDGTVKKYWDLNYDGKRETEQ